MVNICVVKDKKTQNVVKKGLNSDINVISLDSLQEFRDVIDFIDIIYINVESTPEGELISYVKLARFHNIKIILQVDKLDEDIFNVIKDGVDKIIEKGSNNKDILKEIKEVILRGDFNKELSDIIKDDGKRLGYDLKRYRDSVLVLIDIENY